MMMSSPCVFIDEVLDVLVDLIFRILDPIIELLNLLTDRKRGFGGEISASPTRAINTSANTPTTVNIGTGHTCIESNLSALFTEGMAQIIVIGIIALVAIAIGVRIARCLRHRVLLSAFITKFITVKAVTK